MTILDSVTFRPVDIEADALVDGVPYVTHEGTLDLGGFRFHVCQLSNGQRIIPCEELEAFFANMEAK